MDACAAARDHLSTLDWAGNVRQLENLCRWLTVMAPGREVVLEDLPQELRDGSAMPAANAATPVAHEKPADAQQPAPSAPVSENGGGYVQAGEQRWDDQLAH